MFRKIAEIIKAGFTYTYAIDEKISQAVNRILNIFHLRLARPGLVISSAVMLLIVMIVLGSPIFLFIYLGTKDPSNELYAILAFALTILIFFVPIVFVAIRGIYRLFKNK